MYFGLRGGRGHSFECRILFRNLHSKKKKSKKKIFSYSTFRAVVSGQDSTHSKTPSVLVQGQDFTLTTSIIGGVPISFDSAIDDRAERQAVAADAQRLGASGHNFVHLQDRITVDLLLFDLPRSEVKL